MKHIDELQRTNSINMTEDNVEEDKMHGSIFTFLKRFVESKYDYSTWVKILESTGIQHSGYQMHEMYPTQELVKIVGAVSELSGATPHELQEQFGAFLVPDLLMIYKKILIQLNVGFCY